MARVKLEDSDYGSTPPPEGFVKSGSTLLDQILGGGWPIGRIVNVVGDKSAGKTLIAIEAIANFRAAYPDGSVVYNETEAAFDDAYAETLGIPISTVDMLESCATVEDLFKDIQKRIKTTTHHHPTLYIVDSLDALSDEAEVGRDFETGSYGMTKAKQLSKLFRMVTKQIAQRDFLLMIISQIRDNVGVTFGKKHTRAGGRALDFYASQIVWLAHVKRLEKQISGAKRAYGVQVVASCEKNKIGMPFRKCSFPIVFGFGIDDLTANLEFLDECKALDEPPIPEPCRMLNSAKRHAEDLSPEAYNQLREVVARHAAAKWNSIEDAFRPSRRKY